MTATAMTRVVVVLFMAAAALAQPDADNDALTTAPTPMPTVTKNLDQGRAPGMTPGTPATTTSALSTVSASSDRDETGQSSVSSTASSPTSTLNAGRGTATPGTVPPATTQTATATAPINDADDAQATTVTEASVATTTSPLSNGRLNESWVRAREPCYPGQVWLSAEDLVGAVFQLRATDLGYTLTDGPDGVVVLPCGDSGDVSLPATFRAVAPLVPVNSSRHGVLLSLQVMSAPHLYLQRQALDSEDVVLSALPSVDTQPPSSALLLAVWEVHPSSGSNGTAVSFASPDSDMVDGVLRYISVLNKPPMSTSPAVTFGPLRPSLSSSFNAIAPPAPQTTLPPPPSSPPPPPTSGSSFPVAVAAAPVALVAIVALVVLFLRLRRKPTRLQPLKLEEENQYLGMVANPMRAGAGAGDAANSQAGVRDELQDSAVGGAAGAARTYEEPVPQYQNQPWLPQAEYVEPLGAGTVAVAAVESYAYESAAPAPQTVAGTAAAAAATTMLPRYAALAAKAQAPVDYEPSLDSATSAFDTDHAAGAASAAAPAQYEAVKESNDTKGHEEVYSYATAGEVRRYQHLVPSYAEPNAHGPDDDESVYLQEDGAEEPYDVPPLAPGVKLDGDDDADEPYDVPPLAPGVKLDGDDDNRPYDVPPMSRRADSEGLPAAAYSDLSASHGVYAVSSTTTDTPDWNSNA